MKLVGMMPVRNEAFCLGLSLRVALLWCDEVVVLLHACTDDSERITRDVLRESPGRVTILRDMDGTWNEMPHRQRILEAARDRGATHLAIVDADEVMSGELLNSCWDKWLHLMPTGSILQLPGYNLRNGINQYHDNGVWGNRWFSTAFADALDLGWSGDKFHSREPGPRKLIPYRPIQQGQGGTLHLWGASERRLIAKHRMYRIVEALRFPDKPHTDIERMYSWATHGDPGNASYGTPETWTFASVPDSWWDPYREWIDKYLHLDEIPWQEAWCDEMIERHGIQRFKGLSV